MSQTPAEKAALAYKAGEQYTQLYRLTQAMGGTTLEYLGHPDITPEQVADVAARYARAMAALRDAHTRTIRALQDNQQGHASVWRMLNRLTRDYDPNRRSFYTKIR